MVSFVYKWTDKAYDLFYIGSHKVQNKKKKGWDYISSSSLFLDQYKSRPEDFSREILVLFDEYKDAHELECKLLEGVDARNNPKYYNLDNGTYNFHNKTHSEETKNKIGRANKGKIRSDEDKIKNRIAHLGKKASEETKKKMSFALKGNQNNLGKKRSEETIQKLKGRIPWNKNKKTGIKPWLGKKRSPETKEKIREAAKKQWQKIKNTLE